MSRDVSPAAAFVLRLAPRPLRAVLLAVVWGVLAVLSVVVLVGQGLDPLRVVTLLIALPLAVVYTAASVLHLRDRDRT